MVRYQRGSSATTKAEILDAARRLFAERGMEKVTMRDIAAEANVAHTLVHQYFGSKAQFVETLIRAELDATRAFPGPTGSGGFESLRGAIRQYLGEGKTYLRLVARAELDGFAPETLLDPEEGGPIRTMAQALAKLQAQKGVAPGELPDPNLVAAVVGSALFGFATLAPWLTAALGLAPDELDARREEVLDLLVGLVAAASGVAPRGGQPAASQPARSATSASTD